VLLGLPEFDMHFPASVEEACALLARHGGEAEILATLIADVLDKPNDDANLERVAGEVKALCARFPVYA